MASLRAYRKSAMKVLTLLDIELDRSNALKLGAASVVKTATMAITTSNSTNVKPLDLIMSKV